jgi:uncharacterized membrane protein
MEVTTLVLSITYFFHLTATVVWIGGQVTAAWIVLPVVRKHLDEKAYGLVLDKTVSRLQTIGWFCLAVLAVTGLFQMSANRNYDGFLAITNTWAVAILIKHVLIGAMVLSAAYLTWFISPALRRIALRLAQGLVSPPEFARLRQQERTFIQVNLVLSLIVLALTALARSVS